MDDIKTIIIVIVVIILIVKIFGKSKKTSIDPEPQLEQRKNPGRRTVDWLNAYDNNEVSREEFLDYIQSIRKDDYNEKRTNRNM